MEDTSRLLAPFLLVFSLSLCHSLAFVVGLHRCWLPCDPPEEQVHSKPSACTAHANGAGKGAGLSSDTVAIGWETNKKKKMKADVKGRRGEMIEQRGSHRFDVIVVKFLHSWPAPPPAAVSVRFRPPEVAWKRTYCLLRFRPNISVRRPVQGG